MTTDRFRILVIADRLGKLNPKGDSTLVLVREAIRRGHQVFWATETDVRFINGQVRVAGARCYQFEENELPKLDSAQDAAIEEFNSVWIRRDPPFDTNYVKLCWLLSLAENKVWMLNKPSLLLRYHEKLVPLEACANGYLDVEDVMETHIGNWNWAKREVQERKWQRVVTKPFLGYGGRELNRWDAGTVLNSPPPPNSDDFLVQPYYEEVTQTGDRRVFFLEGQVMAHFVRIPKSGNFVSNLAQGGSAVSAPLSEKEEKVLEKLGKFLKVVGIDLAGADVIDGKISEVNVTSPTGLRNLGELESNDYSSDILNFVEKKCGLQPS